MNNAYEDIIGRAFDAYPGPYNFTSFPSNDTDILRKNGIAPEDIDSTIQHIYSLISSVNSTNSTEDTIALAVSSVDEQTFLKFGVAVANVSCLALWKGLWTDRYEKEFNIMPKPTEPAYWDFRYALTPNESTTLDLPHNISLARALFDLDDFESITWFPAAAVSIISVCEVPYELKWASREQHSSSQPCFALSNSYLAVMGSLFPESSQHLSSVLHTDRWEWVNLVTVGGAGIAYSLLSLLDIGDNKPFTFKTDSDGNWYNSDSAIYRFEGSLWP